MNGLHVMDTSGSMFGVDQFCDCSIGSGISVGDTVEAQTDDGVLTFQVALIESYTDGGSPATVIGVGLKGDNSEMVMPGDTLQIVATDDAVSIATSSVHVTVDENQQLEVKQQLLAA